MQITVERDALLRPLLQISNVVEKRQTLPILANALVRCEPGKMTLTATDLEIELKTELAISGTDQFEFTVPARKLTDICKALPEDKELKITLQGDKVRLNAGKGRYSLGTLPAQDYPSLDAGHGGQHLRLSGAVLARLIERVQFAMAQQDVRYYLNGMQLEIKPGRIRAVATDGHRLALCEADYEKDSIIDLQMLIPRKAVIELGRLLAEHEGEVELEAGASHFRVQIGGTRFVSKLIDGRFPDYERVMPSDESNYLLADRTLLRQALVRTSILSNEKYRGIRFQLDTNLVQLEANNPEQDEAIEEVEVEYQGDAFTVGFNVSYLLDVLGVLSDDVVMLSIQDASSSCLIRSKDKQDCRYVVMPMRL